jgi:hypothetical protein
VLIGLSGFWPGNNQPPGNIAPWRRPSSHHVLSRVSRSGDSMALRYLPPLPRSTRMSIRSPSTLPIYPRHRRRSARHDAGAENKHPKHFLGRRLSSDVRPLCPDVITRLHRAFPSGSGSCADSPACAARRRAMTRFRPRTRRRQPRMARMCPDQKPIADLGLAVCNFGKPGRKARRQGNVRRGSFATGSNQLQVRPCPQCRRKRK